LEEKGERKIISAVSPHAGYMFSGPVAAHLYFALAQDGIPNSIVVLGPNHYGVGTGLSVMDEGAWQTPLGDVEIDSDLARAICVNSGMMDVDASAHSHEHSIEVQLPFLQYVYGDRFKFVPISMMMQDLETSRNVGKAIAKSAGDHNILILASSDMSHYEPQKAAERKDGLAVNAILKLDEEELQNTVELENISMCGYGPVSSAIVAAKLLHGTSAKVTSYHTSGDITGDHTQVVGYLSAVISR
jgi:AmmeMemoRadiSam system protein B